MRTLSRNPKINVGTKEWYILGCTSRDHSKSKAVSRFKGSSFWGRAQKRTRRCGLGFGKDGENRGWGVGVALWSRIRKKPGFRANIINKTGCSWLAWHLSGYDGTFVQWPRYNFLNHLIYRNLSWPWSIENRHRMALACGSPSHC